MASPIICIIGLGNPGAKYQRTRHNVGFDWLDALIESTEFSRQKIQFKEKHESLWASGHFENHEVHLLKPLTYMNESGRALADWRSKHQGAVRILTVFDDLDIPLGRLRFRAKGSDGGHRGLRSLVERVPNDGIERLRVGIGKPADESIDHVLGKFTPEERDIMEKVLADAPWQFRIWLEEKTEMAMNKLNGKIYGTLAEGDAHGS